MSLPPESPEPRSRGVAGGFFLAVGLVGGVIVGTAFGEPSIGFIAGFGLGLAALTLVWLLDRRR